jgi:DNA-binding MarR family transcriptional regulator
MNNSTQLVQIIRQWMDVFMHRSMSDWSRYVKSTGLSMPQFNILMQLHYKGRSGLSDVSERMDISAAAASQLVDRLVVSGLVERAEDPSDRRAKHIALTAKGEALIAASIEERMRWVETLTLSLDPLEQESVAGALQTLIEAAGRVEASGLAAPASP